MKKNNEMAKITGMGGLVAAGIGSVCCVGPIVLAGLGFSAGALSFAREFGVLHMPLMILAVLLLAGAFYFRFAKKDHSVSTTDCCNPLDKKNQNIPLYPVI